MDAINEAAKAMWNAREEQFPPRVRQSWDERCESDDSKEPLDRARMDARAAVAGFLSAAEPTEAMLDAGEDYFRKRVGIWPGHEFIKKWWALMAAQFVETLRPEHQSEGEKR